MGWVNKDGIKRRSNAYRHLVFYAYLEKHVPEEKYATAKAIDRV